MTDNSIIDFVVGPALILLTGTDIIAGDFSFLDIISKFGVVAVIWFWLQETKKLLIKREDDAKVQLSKQEDLFDKKLTELNQLFKEENTEIRSQYEKMTAMIVEQHKEYTNRIDNMVKEKSDENRVLQEKLLDLADKNKS